MATLITIVNCNVFFDFKKAGWDKCQDTFFFTNGRSIWNIACPEHRQSEVVQMICCDGKKITAFDLAILLVVGSDPIKL